MQSIEEANSNRQPGNKSGDYGYEPTSFSNAGLFILSWDRIERLL